MVEDLNHDRYKDDTKDRIAEVSSSMGNSGTVVSLGMALHSCHLLGMLIMLHISDLIFQK